MVGGFLLLFLSIIPLVHSLSFTFDRFTAASAQNLTFERTAVVNSSIQLTSDRLASIGRATYGEPLHLWDKATGNLTAFNTHFAFVIDSKGSNRYGDGFAFFLAPVGSRIPPNATKGGGFGLANDDDRLNSSRNTFVAVEFDIYMNEEYDSQSKEVGIDVDSLKSAVSQTWFPDIEGGRPNEAWINYDPRSMNLSVVFTTLVNNRSVFDHLSYVVDLRKFLPEMVTFGFAGATGNRSALQKITSWNFTSTFDVSQIQANPESKSARKGQPVGIVIGVVVGGCFLIGGFGVLLFVVWRRSKMREKFEDEIFGQSPLTWQLRYKIVQDLASALLYLHEECEKCIVHRDIKSSNIMLDSNLNAKLGDFGLARLVDHEKGSRTTALAGTMGYIALECVVSGKASKETDIYSFGIVTLEIACGRKPIDPTAEESRVNIVEWVWKLYGTGQILDAADPNLSSDFTGREVEQMMIVGLWCAHPDCSLRPSIRQAIQVLNFEAPLPDLPETMPIATFIRPQPKVAYSPSSSYYGSDVSQTSQTQSSICSVHPLSFNFDQFTPSNVQNITFERTSVVNNSIQITPNQRNSIGRATYAEPLHLWDKPTGKLASFNTHFAFVIDSNGSAKYGDGFAFFLAPVGSRIPRNATKGGGFGLANDDERLNSSNKFVAVEFDVYLNHYDTEQKHVGIDVDSLQSVVTATWSPDIERGRIGEAWINYDPRSMNLSVVFRNLGSYSHVSYILDLRKYLPEKVTFGFSGATGRDTALQMINSWIFTSALDISENQGDRKSTGKGLVIGLVVGGCFVIGGFMAFSFLAWRKRKMREEFDDDIFGNIGELGGGARPKRFTYRELARATNSFSQQDKLGEGGFGSVYKGYLKELDSYVAVKRVSRGSKQGIKEYASEVRVISRIRHKNLVHLIGWCHENKDLLLVYEFLSNGSLDSHLYKGKSLLTWPLRYKIVQDLASALLYLHEECEKCIVHRDIKASNIMLDSNLNAKLGDFGLARLVDHEKGSRTTALAGTMGYIAIECVTSGKASKETDMYSFGIVTLEIASGRKPIDPTAEECHVNIVDWVWKLYGTGQLLDAADPNLSGDFNGREVEQMMIVGLWCAHPDCNLRPSIRQAIQVLNFEAPLPDLPETMPVATFWPQRNVQYSSSSSHYSSDVSQTSQTKSLVSSGNTDCSCSSAV
nr:L-type lectin-domain containing receptor kinase IX.1-like [Ipomoea batatas]